ncbi:MAG TPA: DUF6599 family protein [Blastocatellia bacterium]|nr:DUF6599 family protein [Blastocatellia bacterium]
MRLQKKWQKWPTLIILLTFLSRIEAQVVPIATTDPFDRLLSDALGGAKATSDIKRVSGDNLTELVAESAAVYQEYRVMSAASREYGAARVDVFETQNQFAAFGLFTFNTVTGENKTVGKEFGSGSASLDGAIIFWKGRFFIRVNSVNHKPASTNSGAAQALARAVADEVGGGNSGVTRPPLLDSLPEAAIVPDSKRYVLGPESLNAYVAHAREMFEFRGDTEAVVGEYRPVSVAGGATQEHSSEADSLLKLAIVEYHTPQFATDAMLRVNDFVSSLPEGERERIVVKRTGNYIIEAANVRDREFAESLVNSVQYPYTVKWLRNPLWPTNDPFRTQKAAQMLLSTFGLLGLILMTVLVVGSVLGTTIFLKRRKQQRKAFSDAGGMLRLEIDPFESVILGLPPKRSEE